MGIRKPIFRQGNLWDGSTTTGAAGFSDIVDLKQYPNISIHGSIEADTTLSFFVSTDGVNFNYCATISSDISPAQKPGGSTYPKYFHAFETIGARYVKLQSTNDVTVTATVEAKL